MMNEKFLMSLDAAKILDRSPEMVRVYAARGVLPSIKTSNGVRLFREEDVQKLSKHLRTIGRRPRHQRDNKGE